MPSTGVSVYYRLSSKTIYEEAEIFIFLPFLFVVEIEIAILGSSYYLLFPSPI
jgi:hypothetical protein